MFSNIINNNKKNTSEFHDKIEFQLPISYLNNKYKLNNNIKSDLELLDISNNSLYNNILSDLSNNSTKLINKWSEYYTTDLEYTFINMEEGEYYYKIRALDNDPSVVNPFFEENIGDWSEAVFVNYSTWEKPMDESSGIPTYTSLFLPFLIVGVLIVIFKSKKEIKFTYNT